MQVETKLTAKKRDRAPRADAARNRTLLLTAAEALFKECGAGVSLDDIARQAGVGIGTLYRHFPTREALLAAACDERLFALAETSRARDATMGAGAAFRAYLIDLIRNTAMYSGLAASLGIVLRNGSPGCHAALEEGLRLLSRAQRARDIRSDVSIEDVVCIATAIALAAAEDARPKTHIERLVTMFVDGIAQR